ncbi:transport and golgi organization 11 [Brevipalpus obovatus]|uniref:transport and golgi organization 11 n=1 Tax=Brevipalpus obovatus TaxID=246614 RepID=UPI003D9E2835
MSTNNSPSRKPAAFDGSKLFDTNYSDYSNQMKVPQRIVMDGFGDNGVPMNGIENPVSTDDFSNMHVPERIVVVGGDRLASSRELFPEMRLENIMMDFGKNNPIDLPTPPSTLTLEEMSQRMGSETSAKARRKVSVDLFEVKGESMVEDGRSSSFDEGNQTLFSGLNTSMDEFTSLKRQFRYLQKRVSRVESENERRNQREVFLYTIGVLYFTVKGLLFLRKIW